MALRSPSSAGHQLHGKLAKRTYGGITIKTLLRRILSTSAATPHAGASGATGNSLDFYVTDEASRQNALDLFKGEWNSRMPAEAPELVAGEIPLFDDHRLKWASEQLGGFEGLRVLELGPLEAGHTYMMDRAGANSILSIEANNRAFLKCLVTKNLFNLDRSTFLLGDFITYLRDSDEKFDFCLASGVLYHMRRPAELLELIAKSADRALIATHYYDAGLVEPKPEVKLHFGGETEVQSHAGLTHTLHKYAYQPDALNSPGFCGGSARYSLWMERQDILESLRHFGFTNIETGLETPDHPHGPAFAIYASR